MFLEILSADKAKLFSFPAGNQTRAQAVGVLRAAGWTEAEAHAHVAVAVASGAYRLVDPVPGTPEEEK